MSAYLVLKLKTTKIPTRLPLVINMKRFRYIIKITLFSMGMPQNPIILCHKYIVFCDNIKNHTLAEKLG